MALKKAIRTIGNGFGEEMKQFRSILGRIRLTTDTSAIGANFRTFGHSFGTYDFDAFVAKARMFFAEALKGTDPHFTVINLADNRFGIDFDGEVRGIFTHRGKPLAFFRPDYRQLGYSSKGAELEDFRNGKKILFS